MSARELALWHADYLEQPWDLRTISEQLAMLITLLANVHRNAKKRKKPYEVNDFMPGNAPRKEIPVETREQRVRRLMAILKPLARIERKKETQVEQ